MKEHPYRPSVDPDPYAAHWRRARLLSWLGMMAWLIPGLLVTAARVYGGPRDWPYSLPTAEVGGAIMLLVGVPLFVARWFFRCPRCHHRFNPLTPACAQCGLVFGTPKPLERELDAAAQRRAEAERAEAARWGPSTDELQERDRRSHDRR